jgi:DNA polymerase III epsilon subunit-like protein
MPKLILGLDLETTGKDTSKDRIIEIGAVIWDAEKGIPLKIFSEMVYFEGIWDEATATKERIEEITHISFEHLVQFGIAPTEALQKLADLMRTPNLLAVVAHNGEQFDRQLVIAEFKRWGIELPEVHWLDTMTDVPYEGNIQTRKLTYLAAEHGFINPFAHRAIFDVLTMLKMTQQYDIDWLIKLSKEPSVTLIALTTAPWEDGGKSNEEAKARGYRFQSEGKKWIKLVKESQIQSEKASAPFGIREMR